MKRVTLYSASQTREGGRADLQDSLPEQHPDSEEAGPPAPRRGRLRQFCRRRERLLWAIASAGLVAAVIWGHDVVMPRSRTLTQRDIDAAVLHTLETQALPSTAAKAYGIVRPSVVRVRSLVRGEDGEDREIGVGSGVVVVDSGVILTSLHVVSGAERVGVVFSDGLESGAAVVSEQPDQDLAVLQAKRLPDDLIPATLRSTQDLAPGDEVIAVGFPLGIGPSVSDGVISGLNREYHHPDDPRVLRNLIQFDAAVNPGSSGGPLVTARGEVVGVVTAILNPTGQHVFIGIGFAVPIESAAGAIGISPF